jgi:hypothetical protein
MKRKFASMLIFASECSLVLRIFSSEYSLECEIHLKICEYLLQNEYLKQIFASVRKCICLASNRIFICEFVRIF